jgi:hypothetical protein
MKKTPVVLKGLLLGAVLLTLLFLWVINARKALWVGSGDLTLALIVTDSQSNHPIANAQVEALLLDSPQFPTVNCCSF